MSEANPWGAALVAAWCGYAGVAYVVAGVLGLESVGSRDYLLQYQIGPTELRAALATIAGLVRQVLAVVEPAKATPARLAA